MDKPLDRRIDLSHIENYEVANNFTELKNASPIETKIPSSPPIKSHRNVNSKGSDNFYENVTPIATSIQSSSSSGDEKTPFLNPSLEESLFRPKTRSRSQRPSTGTLSQETGSQSACEEEFEAAGRSNERQRLLTTEEFTPSRLDTDESGSEGSQSLDFGDLTLDEVVAGLPSRQRLNIKGQLNCY